MVLAQQRRTAPRVGVGTIGRAVGVATTAVCLSGCSWFSGSSADDAPQPVEVSVFDVQPGQCFAAQQEVQAEIATLGAIPCDGPHRQESYAIVAYEPPPGLQVDAFPGDANLKSYADARCAEQFESYVGISYLDSSLFFTYLTPSARGWEQSNDRSVVCFITTTGTELTSSVKASKL
ncbi:MAG TPA: septum formation family protein [Nakamurella sp.]